MQKEGYSQPPLTDTQIEAFLAKALSKAGAEEMVTPREIIRDYLTLLNILRDNRDASFEGLMGSISFSQSDSEQREEPTSQSPVSSEAPKPKISLFDIDI